MHPVLKTLEGGARRSIGRSNEVVARVLEIPNLMKVLFYGMTSDDPLVRMQCADAVEKVTALHPEYLRPYKNSLIETLAKTIRQPPTRDLRGPTDPDRARLDLKAGFRNSQTTSPAVLLKRYRPAVLDVVQSFFDSGVCLRGQRLFGILEVRQVVEHLCQPVFRECLYDSPHILPNVH